MITVDRSLYNHLLQNLDQIRKNYTPKQIRDAMRKAAAPVIKAIKANTPYRTGRLRRSIGVLPYIGASTGTVIVGVKRDRKKEGKGKKDTTVYARFVEFGTRKRKARPFFYKGYDQSKDEALNVMQDELKKLTLKNIR